MQKNYEKQKEIKYICSLDTFNQHQEAHRRAAAAAAADDDAAAEGEKEAEKKKGAAARLIQLQTFLTHRPTPLFSTW